MGLRITKITIAKLWRQHHRMSCAELEMTSKEKDIKDNRSLYKIAIE